MAAAGSGTSAIVVSGEDLRRRLEERLLGGGDVGGELGRPAILRDRRMIIPVGGLEVGVYVPEVAAFIG